MDRKENNTKLFKGMDNTSLNAAWHSHQPDLRQDIVHVQHPPLNPRLLGQLTIWTSRGQLFGDQIMINNLLTNNLHTFAEGCEDFFQFSLHLSSEKPQVVAAELKGKQAVNEIRKMTVKSPDARSPYVQLIHPQICTTAFLNYT